VAGDQWRSKRHAGFLAGLAWRFGHRRADLDLEGFSARAQCGEVLGVGTASGPPKWIKPQLTRLVDEAPVGNDWLHEIKYDGYRMHARLDGERVQLLTRTGLDWSHAIATPSKRCARCP
jgi:hypothetical protein